MKIHMVRSELPLQNGVDTPADCGRIVKSAYFAFVFDTDYQEAATLNSLAVCQKCYATRGEGRYLYGLVDGESSIHREGV